MGKIKFDQTNEIKISNFIKTIKKSKGHLANDKLNTKFNKTLTNLKVFGQELIESNNEKKQWDKMNKKIKLEYFQLMKEYFYHPIPETIAKINIIDVNDVVKPDLSKDEPYLVHDNIYYCDGHSKSLIHIHKKCWILPDGIEPMIRQSIIKCTLKISTNSKIINLLMVCPSCQQQFNVINMSESIPKSSKIDWDSLGINPISEWNETRKRLIKMIKNRLGYMMKHDTIEGAAKNKYSIVKECPFERCEYNKYGYMRGGQLKRNVQRCIEKKCGKNRHRCGRRHHRAKVKCKSCKATQCNNCDGYFGDADPRLNHEGRDCNYIEMVNKILKDSDKNINENELTKKYIEANSKDCPKCKSSTIKINGCDHMTCTKCTTHWCWLCKYKLDSNIDEDGIYRHLEDVHNIYL
jgi:hypothetical protein